MKSSVKEKIKTLTHKYINIRSSTTTFKIDIVKRSLDNNHDSSVIEPIDKANGNIATNCKHFYMQVLKKNLGIDNALNTNST